MRFLILGVQTLNAKERHVVFPFVMATFIMQSVAFILCHPSSYNAQFSLTLKDHHILGAIFIAFCTNDNLLEVSYSIHR